MPPPPAVLFQNHGIAAAFGFDERVTFAVKQARSRQQWRSHPQCNFSGGVFQAECVHLCRRWTEKNDAGVLACLCKAGILTEKPVAGMNRFGAR